VYANVLKHNLAELTATVYKIHILARKSITIIYRLLYRPMHRAIWCTAGSALPASWASSITW